MTTRKITASAIMAAIIFVVTLTLKLPIPATAGGYINLGDVAIYLSAYLFGGPVTAAAAAIGSALADMAVGSAVYIPATFIIKGLMGFFCGCLCIKKRFSMFLLSCAMGGAVMTLGYALYESFIFGTAYAAASLPFNVIQWVGGGVAATALFPAAKRLSNFIERN